MKSKAILLSRKEAQKIDFKLVLCSNGKFFVLSDGGWTSFQKKKTAQAFIAYKNAQ